MQKIGLWFALGCWSIFGVEAQNPNPHPWPSMGSCNGPQVDVNHCFFQPLQQQLQSFPRLASVQGHAELLLAVDEQGKCQLVMVEASNEALTAPLKAFFFQLPRIEPAYIQGRPVYQSFQWSLDFPLNHASTAPTPYPLTPSTATLHPDWTTLQSDHAGPFVNPKYQSSIPMPLNHIFELQQQAALQQPGALFHSAMKPYDWNQVNQYAQLSAQDQALKKGKTSYWGRKLWDEDFIGIQGKDYWVTLNPVFDIQMGRTQQAPPKNTYINSRVLQIQGGLGETLTFSTSLYETQGRFAPYFNQYAESIQPAGGNPAIIPGVGIAKAFKTDAYDFPLADAHLVYRPQRALRFELGYGKNFIGDGYRSLLLSDAGSPYPFFKMQTQFCRIQYTNLYTWLKDVRPEVTLDQTYASKYMAAHYLSMALSPRWDLGLFESVVWANTNDRGYDINFVNPIIFYRTVEFTSSSRSGNALLGLTLKHKWSAHTQWYGQFLLDEFSLSDVKAQKNSWKNKYGLQLGVQLQHLWGRPQWSARLEFNSVRPYVYSHSNVLTNYGHNNQSLGHPWGGNFNEWILQCQYHQQRWTINSQLTYGVRGLDYPADIDPNNYGSNPYLGYNDNRPFDEGVVIGQGNKSQYYYASLEARYLINPMTRMQCYAAMRYRQLRPHEVTTVVDSAATVWVSFGIKADLFNWYFDY